MEFGFVVPVVAPVLPQVVTAVGLAAGVLATALGVKQVVDATSPQEPQTSVGGPVVFEPWGPDPYEVVPERPAPAPGPAVKRSPAESVIPPAPPSPVRETAETAKETSPGVNRDPQNPGSESTPGWPSPDLAPGESDLLSIGVLKNLFIDNSEYSRGFVPTYQGQRGPTLKISWDRVVYTVKYQVLDTGVLYSPGFEFYKGGEKQAFWFPEIQTEEAPKKERYNVIALYNDAGPQGETFEFLLTPTYNTDIVVAVGEFQPIQLVKKQLVPFGTEPQTETEQEKKVAPWEQYEPLPEPEVEPDRELAPLPETLPLTRPLPVPTPIAPPGSRPLRPNQPNPVPITDTAGRPVNPPVVRPVPPDVHFPVPGGPAVGSGGARGDLVSVAKEVGRVESKSAQGLQNQNSFFEKLDNILDLIELIELLKDIFEKPLPSVEYSITGICEDTPEDDPQQPSTTVILPEEMWADRLISQVDALPTLLQAHLGYKTPTCASKKPQKDGTWVSTRWVSDGDSDNSTRRLRKLFRYRSKSTRTPKELQGWWAPFTWTAGGTIVSHNGGWWGTPQVWASSAAEGKRVIRFAGTEAGINPDTVGEWFITTTDDPRYGMSDTMRLAKPHGDYWVTRRDGPTGFDM